MSLPPDEELTEDRLAGDWYVLQRRRGHRYSVDDVATAWEASRVRRPVRRYLDLGCGIGSVLLMTAYRRPDASCVGIEAQGVSFALAERNIDRNGISGRVQVVQGDIRDRAQIEPLGLFDLISGTPPYKTPAEGTVPADSQKAHARFELRGGVEAYLEAASRALAPGGRFVMCAVAAHAERVALDAERMGLTPLSRRDVIPRAGKAVLFSVWTFGRTDELGESEGEFDLRPAWRVRNEAGVRTLRSWVIKRSFGIPIEDLRRR